MSRSFARLLASLLAFTIALPALAATDFEGTPPMDPAVVHGVLPNGLTYYIRANEKPEDRVELRLVVRTGSVQETDEEQGLAHFIEHMNFNGSENFGPGELVEYLESIGARFGADSNAYTSFDETVYFLQVPTDKKDTLDKGMLILSDWAGRATLLGEEIDKERGVVADELRGSKGAGKRLRDKQLPIIWKGSRYAERLPIGKEDIIMNASHETVRGYYEKWYRPENIAVVVVGTIDPEAMEAMVKELFGSLPTTPADERIEVPTFPVPPHDATLYTIESDAELSSSSVSVTHKHPDGPARTGLEAREELVDALAGFLLTLRLQERSQSADPPFLAARAGMGGGFKTAKTFSLNARARDGEVPKATAALMEELERARAHGFVGAELDRVKALVLNSAESRYKERDQARSRSHAQAAVRSFLDQEPLTSAEYDYQYAKAVVPGIGIEEVNASLLRHTRPSSRVVAVQAPAKDGAVPSQAEMEAAMASAGGKKIAAYVDEMAGKELMSSKPAPGRILSKHRIPEVGVTEIVLSNDVTVIVKPTDFRNDQILMRGFKHDGVAWLSEAEKDNGWRADSVAGESGLAGFKAPELRKLLTEKLASAGVGIGNFMLSASGNATPEDIETMFQLLHLRFTQPAFREDAFDRVVDRERESLRNQLNSPNGVYGRQWTKVAYDGHAMFEPTTMADLDGLDLEEMERLYGRFFDDASGWTFVIVGNFDLEKHLPHLETYVASLPSSRKGVRRQLASRHRPDYGDLRIQMPLGKTTRAVAKGIEDQARTSFMIWAPTELDPEERRKLGYVTDLLQIRLRERLREERGDTYGVGVGQSTLAPYPGYGRVTVSWGSSPAARTSMVNDVIEEIQSLKKRGPDADELHALKEMRLSSLEEGRMENGWWLGNLGSSYRYARDPRRILDAEMRIHGTTSKDVRSAARKHLDLGRTAEVYLVPAGWAADAWAPDQRQRAAEMGQ
jgi:zinc protease